MRWDGNLRNNILWRISLVEDKLEKHHIVPRYRCVELVEEGILVGSYKIQGVEFYFEENMVQVTKEDHAYIHWGYFNDNLEALFKYVKPQQWIIDLIPRRDNRDLGATKITANGLIEDIDMSGENHPRWGTKHSEESKKKIGDASRGKTKKKRSESRKGKKYSRKKISFEQYFKIDEANRKKRMKQISYSLEDFLQALQLIAKES